MAKPSIVQREPAVTIGAVVAVIVFICGQLDFIVEPSTVETVVSSLLVLATAVGIRTQVTPAP